MKTELEILRDLANHYAENGYSKAIKDKREIAMMNTCGVTPALTKDQCGTTCCTPEIETPNELDYLKFTLVLSIFCFSVITIIILGVTL